MSDQVLGIIPARIASTRLPRKPLHPIHGRPLIEWVWRRVQSLGHCDEVVVATDSAEIQEACRRFGARVEMTSPSHPSGTDRVAEVAARSEYGRFDLLVNVQGDEPLISDEVLEGAIGAVRDGGWPAGTCATPIRDEAEWRDPSVVKVVIGERGRALYFSRAPIPHARDVEPDFSRGDPWLRHVGIYAYRREALERWVSLPESRLERTERLEQLRPLEAGVGIGVRIVAEAEGGVDTRTDVARVEPRLKEWQASGYV